MDTSQNQSLNPHDEHDEEHDEERTDEKTTRAPGFLVGESQLGRDPLRAPGFLCDDDCSLCDADGHEIAE